MKRLPFTVVHRATENPSNAGANTLHILCDKIFSFNSNLHKIKCKEHHTHARIIDNRSFIYPSLQVYIQTQEKVFLVQQEIALF